MVKRISILQQRGTPPTPSWRGNSKGGGTEGELLVPVRGCLTLVASGTLANPETPPTPSGRGTIRTLTPLKTLKTLRTLKTLTPLLLFLDFIFAGEELAEESYHPLLVALV